MAVLTRKGIREMRRNYIKVTAKQERELLKLLWHEPLEDGDLYCYSEQDIYEQTRIYLRDHYSMFYTAQSALVAEGVAGLSASSNFRRA
jgi:hypothetical protein